MVGACFGLITFSNRHLFSEGPKSIDDSPDATNLVSRVMWILVCTFLWPIMVLTGLHSLWILSKKKSKDSVDGSESSSQSWGTNTPQNTLPFPEFFVLTIIRISTQLNDHTNLNESFFFTALLAT